MVMHKGRTGSEEDKRDVLLVGQANKQHLQGNIVSSGFD
jgi:hypothetical protein